MVVSYFDLPYCAYLYIQCTCTHLCICMYIYIYRHILMYIHTHTHVYVLYLCAFMHISTYKGMYVNKWMMICGMPSAWPFTPGQLGQLNIDSNMPCVGHTLLLWYIYIYVIYLYIYNYTHIYNYTYIYIWLYIYIYNYTHIYIYNTLRGGRLPKVSLGV